MKTHSILRVARKATLWLAVVAVSTVCARRESYEVAPNAPESTLRFCVPPRGSAEAACREGTSLTCVLTDAPLLALREKRCDVALVTPPAQDELELVLLGRLASEEAGFSVAVVDASAGPSSLAEFRGKDSCHSFVNDPAGWLAPMATLDSLGLLDHRNHDVSTPNDMESALAFFRSTCAPARSAPALPGSTHTVCDLCPGDCGPDRATEPFAGSRGALQCLAGGASDRVAFLDSASLATEVTQRRRVDGQRLALVCEAGRVPLDDADPTAVRKAAAQCNLGALPAQVLVASSSTSRARLWQLRRTLRSLASSSTLLSSSSSSSSSPWWGSVEVFEAGAAPPGDEEWPAMAVVQRLRSLPYSIGQSVVLQHMCHFPACRQMFQMEARWISDERRWEGAGGEGMLHPSGPKTEGGVREKAEPLALAAPAGAVAAA